MLNLGNALKIIFIYIILTKSYHLQIVVKIVNFSLSPIGGNPVSEKGNTVGDSEVFEEPHLVWITFEWANISNWGRFFICLYARTRLETKELSFPFTRFWTLNLLSVSPNGYRIRCSIVCKTGCPIKFWKMLLIWKLLYD